jgi:hypothetical protein
VSATLVVTIKPRRAEKIAAIHVDGEPLAGTRLELPAPRRVHVSVTALGFRRATRDVDVGDHTELSIELEKLRSHHRHTVAGTVGLAAASVIAWLIRRR